MYPSNSEKLSSIFPPNKVHLPHLTCNPIQLLLNILYTKTITQEKLKNKILHYNLPSCFDLFFFLQGITVPKPRLYILTTLTSKSNLENFNFWTNMLVLSLAGIHLQELKHFSTVKIRISDSGECKILYTWPSFPWNINFPNFTWQKQWKACYSGINQTDKSTCM